MPMKLCPHSGPHHGEKPCLLCWPMMRYEQPLSPRDAENAINDLAFEVKWRGFARQLAEQMHAYWRVLSFDTTQAGSYRLFADMKRQYWAGAHMMLVVIAGRDEHDAIRRRRTRAA
jgi:hypothetical protein